MFEARLLQGSQLKKIIEAIRELVVDANLDCSDEGITMQVELEDPQLPWLVDNLNNRMLKLTDANSKIRWVNLHHSHICGSTNFNNSTPACAQKYYVVLLHLFWIPQAMDSSHVSLCALKMNAEGFDHYRCDKSISLGVNTPNLSKILKCAGKLRMKLQCDYMFFF